MFNASSKVYLPIALDTEMAKVYKFFLFIGISFATWAGSSIAIAEEYRHDENTKYIIQKNSLGFNLDVDYSEYQFIPSQQKISNNCIEMTLLIADQVAKKEGLIIQPVSANNVQISLSRNGLTGTSTCKSFLAVKSQQRLSSF